MREPYLLIDGYNLMHAAGLARNTYGPGELQRCREKLLSQVGSRLSESQRRRTTIVFDAAEPPPGAPREIVVNRMRVLFGGPHEDADAVIESLIRTHAAPRQICLVSGDRRLQTAAKRRRGRFLTSDAFLDKLRKRDDGSEPRELSREQQLKAGAKTPDADVAEWLDLFGDIPETGHFSREEDHWRARVKELLDEEEQNSRW